MTAKAEIGMAAAISLVAGLTSVDPRQLDLPGPTIRFAGSRRPDGGSVKWSREELHGDGRAGQGVAEEATNGRQDAGGGGSGSRHERAQRAPLAGGSVSVTGAQATSLADAARSLCRGVRQRDCTAAGD